MKIKIYATNEFMNFNILQIDEGIFDNSMHLKAFNHVATFQYVKSDCDRKISLAARFHIPCISADAKEPVFKINNKSLLAGGFYE